MPLSEKELLERDAQRDIGMELLQAIRDVKSGRYGTAYEIEPNPIAATRLRCGLSEVQFAAALRVSPRTLRRWEKGLAKPSGTAEILLRIVARHPEWLIENN